MNVRYIEEGKTYVITNHAVAKNHLFKDKHYCTYFIRGVKKYLSSICELVSYSLDGDQFNLIFKMGTRSDFREYYIRKKKSQGKEVGVVPLSTYIFSQAMANLQASMAIHLNRKENRTGALFARRFSKIEIRTRIELENWLDKFARLIKVHQYEGRWRVKSKRRSSYQKKWFRNFVAINKKRANNSDWVELREWLMSQLQGQTVVIYNFTNFTFRTNPFHKFSNFSP